MYHIHPEAFEEIRAWLSNLLVFYHLDNRRKFQLFSDTSTTAEGSALYKIQNGTHWSIGYTSTIYHLSYLITELELLGSCVNISKSIHLLAK